ncbi:MAG: NFACT RNA binding domain-containing protein [Desulfobacterales bacterium]|jgi:predicted ribosome quality control (RQC) complex YloA/Tae2 family protein
MPKGHNHFQAPPLRLLIYTLAQGWKVLAGRTDADNDQLSLRIARPNDWWFHVRGMPGSHVILQVPSDQEPPSSILKQAAAVAAYHSKARNGGVVAVSATRARFVSKPRGAKPGTVHIRKEKVIKIRPALPTAASDANP